MGHEDRSPRLVRERMPGWPIVEAIGVRGQVHKGGRYHVKSTIILRTIYSKTIETPARILETCCTRSASENQGRRFLTGTKSRPR